MRGTGLVALCVALLFGCGDDDGMSDVDAGGVDAGEMRMDEDGGVEEDAGTIGDDGGLMDDAGTSADAGTSDDAGASTEDAGATDAGVADAGTPDSGTPDAGPPCSGDELLCGGACVDPLTDEANCGDCDVVCATGGTCAGGACTCGSGELVCDGACLDVTSDDMNCGGCDVVCPHLSTCDMGRCECSGTRSLCDDRCVLTDRDESNCGGCGIECATGATCESSVCECPMGESVCDDTCVNLLNDETNCGGCGTTCAGDETCIGGSCITGAALLLSGCADGEREGYLDTAAYSTIAACGGGFDVPGSRLATSYECGGEGGDDSANPLGAGCGLADLCAPGWHVCAEPGEVANRAGSCGDAVETPDTFFATRLTGTGAGACTPTGSNDVFGCGNIGSPTSHGTCAPVNRFLQSGTTAGGWRLGANGSQEALNVTHVTAGGGGAICCMDIDVVGCADGEREGFVDVSTHPDIAACGGGFTVAGVTTAASPAQTCGGGAGDDGANPDGTGCAVADFCAPGWHVCDTDADVMLSSATGCDGAATDPNLFYATRQSGPGSGRCGSGTNDVFGCGTFGGTPLASSCAPLNRYLSTSDLTGAWNATGGGSEATTVTKNGAAGGGVLCCRDRAG